MKTRGKILIWVVALVALAVILRAILASRPPDPEYQGRQLSAWLGDLEIITHNNTWEERLRAEAAVWQIGTNAVPYLLAALRKSDPPAWVACVEWIEGQLKRNLNGRLAGRRTPNVAEAFLVLGEQARPWLPALAATATNAPTGASSWAMWAMAKTRCEEVSQILIRALSNRNPEIRRAAVANLGEMGWRGRCAVPVLVRLLQDANPEIRVRAARSLGEIGVEPESVIPALAERLADPDDRVKRSAADALAEFGNSAVTVAPAIRELLGAADTRLVRTARSALHRIECGIRDGALVRGPSRERRIALVFTGHEFAEGGETIVAELSRHQARASFFLTGSFLTSANHQRLVGNILKGGHLIGPHSDRHLLYCSWDSSRKTLVEWHEFRADLIHNIRRIQEREIEVFGEVSAPVLSMVYFLPPYEHYNRDIADWSRELGLTLINYTPGTRSHADYTSGADKNFVSSQAIFDSILKAEREDPHGLNGFILLLHLGSGPKRQDKFHHRFGELLDALAAKGYQFVRVDELLEPKPEEKR